jgi:PD-(D/E)XK nuclease superfamily
MIDWRIYERDVDVILAEEFYANSAFARWILKRSKSFTAASAEVIEVQISLADDNGESDLVVTLENEDNSRIALLIEDKIDAVFQNDQLGRYRLRGQNGVAQKKWSAFEVMLCAPASYIDKSPIAHEFDSTISYEEIAAWLRANVLDRRGKFRADFLESAAPHGASAYVKKTDPETDAFWKAAFDLAHADFPELEMKNYDLASGNTWVEFRPGDLPAAVRVFLKGSSGFADLTFNRVDLHTLSRAVSTLSPLGTLHKTSKSAAIRLTFTPFAVVDGISVVDTKVRAAFERCHELIRYYREHRAVLERLVSK